MSGSAVREFQHRTLRFNDTRRTIWVAFTKDDYATAKSALVGWVSADKRDRARHNAHASEGSGGDSSPFDPSDAVGYVPYDQRLYDALMHLFGRAVLRRHRRDAARSDRVSWSMRRLSCSWAALQAGWPRSRVSVQSRPRSSAGWPAMPTWSSPWRVGTARSSTRAGRAVDPTVAQRIEIARRDKGCRFPGCTFTEFTDVHHVHHWTKGGATNLENLVTLCDRHHRAVHELGWAMSGNADEGLTFTSPHGRVM